MKKPTLIFGCFAILRFIDRLYLIPQEYLRKCREVPLSQAFHEIGKMPDLAFRCGKHPLKLLHKPCVPPECLSVGHNLAEGKVLDGARALFL